MQVQQPAARYHADAIVILGRGLDPHGRLPHAAVERVNRGLALYFAGIAPRIIMSGRAGLMTREPAIEITEAAAMARAALDAGVPRHALFLEEESRDTIGNAYFTARRFLEPNGWSTVRVVTSDYHVPRAAWVFGKVIGSSIDVAFSPASSESFARSVAQRAQQESAIAQFLMEWLRPIPDGDREIVDRFIQRDHPAYGSAPTMTVADIDARVAEIARVYRAEDRKARGHRVIQERPLEL